jgi:hypothetical protein
LVLRCVMSSQVTYGAGVDRSRDLLGSSNVTRAGSSDIVGTWKFRSYVRTAPDTGEYADIMGRHPNGYLIYTPEGRMMVIVVADNREPPKTDEDRIAPHKFMVAYSGRYTVTGGQVVHHVDVSWNQSWTGTDLVRVFKIEDDKPIITTAPTKKYGTDDVQQISTLTLQRVDS